MPENQDYDALAEAVRRGLEMAMSPGGQIESLITNIMDYQASRSEQGGGGGWRDPADSEARLEAAKNVYRQRRVAPDVHNAGDGPSPSASVASNNASEAAAAAQARQALMGGGAPYYRIPPGFGDLEGNSTWQNVAQAVANRNLERLMNARSDAEAMSAERGFRRAAYVSDKVLPTYEIGKKIYQQGVQPTWKAIQGLADVGAVGNIGPVGGEVGPMRIPFMTDSFTRALSMKGSQYARSIFTAGLTMDQVQEIDSMLMGMGYQFKSDFGTDIRMTRGQKMLENMVRYNPTIDLKQWAPILDKTIRFGSQKSVQALTESLKNLDSVAKEAGVSTNQLAENAKSFYAAGMAGGATAGRSMQSMQYLMQTYPNVNPTAILNTLQSNPIAAQQVMARGYMPYAAAIMPAQKMGAALDAALDTSFQQTYGKSIYREFSETEKGSENFTKAIADMISLHGFTEYAPEDLIDLVAGARNRRMARDVTQNYFQTTNGVIDRDKEGAPIMAAGGRLWPYYEGTVDGGQYVSKRGLDTMLGELGLNQEQQDKWAKENLGQDYWKSDGRSVLLTDEVRKRLAKLVEDRSRTEQTTPTDSYNKIIKGAEQIVSGTKELRDKKNDGGNDRDT